MLRSLQSELESEAATAAGNALSRNLEPLVVEDLTETVELSNPESSELTQVWLVILKFQFSLNIFTFVFAQKLLCCAIFLPY